MRFLLLALALALLTGTASEKKPKPPDVQVVETKARREDGKIKLDGRVRNSGEKHIPQLMVFFDFLSPEHRVVTTQHSMADEDILAPGDESAFHVELQEPPGAVEYRIRAMQHGRELRVANDGPFIIE